MPVTGMHRVFRHPVCGSFRLKSSILSICVVCVCISIFLTWCASVARAPWSPSPQRPSSRRRSIRWQSLSHSLQSLILGMSVSPSFLSLSPPSLSPSLFRFTVSSLCLVDHACSHTSLPTQRRAGPDAEVSRPIRCGPASLQAWHASVLAQVRLSLPYYLSFFLSLFHALFVSL